MSYDNTSNFVETFTLTGLTNATVAAALGIRVPTHKGVRFAAIEDIQITPTTAIVNTTLAAVLQIGTLATSGKFAAQNVSALAGLGLGLSYSVADADGRVAAYNPSAAASATNKGFIDLGAGGDGDAGAAITNLKVGTVAGTGTPAGVFNATVTIRWW